MPILFEIRLIFSGFSLVGVSLSCIMEFNACYDEPIRSFFDLFCVFIDYGVREGSNFRLVKGLQN